LNNSVSDWA